VKRSLLLLSIVCDPHDNSLLQDWIVSIKRCYESVCTSTNRIQSCLAFPWTYQELKSIDPIEMFKVGTQPNRDQSMQWTYLWGESIHRQDKARNSVNTRTLRVHTLSLFTWVCSWSWIDTSNLFAACLRSSHCSKKARRNASIISPKLSGLSWR
jgi:hypothetical protein